MQIRSLRHNDLPALLKLWNRAAPYDRLTAALLREKVFDDPDIAAEHRLVACASSVLAGFGLGVVRPSGRDRKGYVKMLAVHPAWRRQGVGRRILERLESALVRSGAGTIRVAESAPNYLVPGIDVRYRCGIAFLASCGYVHVGEARNLSVALGNARFASRPAPERGGWALRRATSLDAAPLTEFLERRWPTWTAEATAALHNDPPTLYLAIGEPGIMGFAAYDANNKDTGWFGPMGVASDARKRGIGRALLQACLADIRAQGHREATIAWVDAIPFYEKCSGAQLARTFSRFEKKTCP